LENALQLPAVPAGLLTGFLPPVPSALLKPYWDTHCTGWAREQLSLDGTFPAAAQGAGAGGPGNQREAALRLPAPRRSGALQGASWREKGVKPEAKKSCSSAVSEQPEKKWCKSKTGEINKKILPTERCTCINRNDDLKHCTPLSAHQKQAARAAAVVNRHQWGCTQAGPTQGRTSGCRLYASGQQHVEKLEGSNRSSAGVLRADFKYWLPLCTPTGRPTRGRIQITTDFIPVKASSEHRLPGDLHTVFRLTMLRPRRDRSLCCS